MSGAVSFFSLHLTSPAISSYNTSSHNQRGTPVYLPTFNPRLPDLLLGLMIGLTLALSWHWVAWTIH